jgi:DNA processing protein
MSHFAPDDAQRLDWLQLIRSENVGPHTFRLLINRYGGARAALDALPALSQKGGLKRQIRICSRDKAAQELERAQALGASLILMGEAHYPKLLAYTYSAPPCLYVLGRTDVLNRPAIGIVGSRKSSALGVEMASILGRDLAKAEYLVVSGLARGVDGAAHRASMTQGTVAVIAGGPDTIYPPEHKDLARAICENGAVICEEGPGYQTRAQDFPRRNRIIAGMSLGVVVVEAALRSGSLITARQALEENRQVFAVPGSPLDPRAVGTNKLIKDGAILTRDANDIIAEFSNFETPNLFAQEPTEITYETANLSDQTEPEQSQREIVQQALSPSPIAMDRLSHITAMPAGIIISILLEMEIAGQIERHPGQRVSLKPKH